MPKYFLGIQLGTDIMRAKLLGRKQNTEVVHRLINPLRQLNNYTNLGYLACDYAVLIAVLGVTIAYCENHARWGIGSFWNIPVVAMAIILIGALQHRLAGLAHEASHYTLLKSKFWNELISDFFCMFPLFAVTHQYRLVHMAHHQFTNEWEHDPDLMHIGKCKMMDQFPMTRWKFVRNYYLRFLMPHVLLRYLWNIISLSAFGNGASPYEKTSPDTHNNGKCRLTGILGHTYFFSVGGALAAANSAGRITAVFLIPPLAIIAAIAVIVALPERMFFRSPLRPIYSAKFTSALRLAWLTAMIGFLAAMKAETGKNWSVYFWVLWVLPLCTSFPYFMLLRDVYQHANADTGKLTNSRVFYADPFTRWAVFVYGMDMHLPHHMFPAIPHYNLGRAHDALMKSSDEYAQNVIECDGVFSNHTGRPTILDVMYHPTRESAGSPSTHEPPHSHAA